MSADVQVVQRPDYVPFNDQDVKDMELQMGLAYRNAADTKADNYGFFAETKTGWVERIRQNLEAQGFTVGDDGTPQAIYDRFFRRFDSRLPEKDPSATLDIMKGLMVNYGSQFVATWRQRQLQGGQVVLAMSGWTGFGKSSAAGSISQLFHAYKPEELQKYFMLDISEIFDKLLHVGPGATLVVDEHDDHAGEGSNTMEAMVANLEKRLRKSRVNLILISPLRKDHEGAAMELEVVLRDGKGGRLLGLFWMEGMIMGHVIIPWMGAPYWVTYSTFKDDSLGKTLKGEFKERLKYARYFVRLFQDPDAVDYLMSMNKPKPAQFQEAIELFYGGMLTVRQKEALAKFTYTMLYAWDRVGHKFPKWFGLIAPVTVDQVAKICYSEKQQ